ncbi:hypothetical protein Dimus_027238 [Dionaea muscipula]
MSHNRKKDVAKSKVRGVEIVFDHLQLASILGIPGNNGICEYTKEVWEESKYTKPLEITRRFTNDESIMEARRVKSVEMKPFQRASDRDSSDSAIQAPSTVQQKVTETSGVDPSCPTGRIPEAVMNEIQAEFERARANRFQADLEKA